MTAQDQQSRAEFEDGKWYWVAHDGWGQKSPIIAPARYRANCDAWYSFEFSGIATRFIKVLEPCERQAARALPQGIEPVAAFSDPQVQVVYQMLSDMAPHLKGKPDDHHWEGWMAQRIVSALTAAQVQAMLAQWAAEADLPDVEDMAHSAVQEALSYGVNHDVFHRWMRTVMEKTVKAVLAAAPRPPAAPVTYGAAAAMCQAATHPAPAAPVTTGPANATTGPRPATAGAEQERKPLFWVRLLRDGLYEGPVHANSADGKLLREAKPDEWHPLYVGLAEAVQERKPLTDEMVLAAARVLNDRQAKACDVDKDDQWKIYSDDFKEDARAMLTAAHGIKEAADAR